MRPLWMLTIVLCFGITANCRTPPASSEVAFSDRRVTIAKHFTMAVPKTAAVTRYPGAHGYIDFIKDTAFELHIRGNAAPLQQHSILIDGRPATIERYEKHDTEWTFPFFVAAHVDDIGMLANCADAAAQDRVERMVRSIQFLQ